MFLGFNSFLSQQAAGNLTQERLKINNKIQNDSLKFSIVGVISDISVASDLRHIGSSEFRDDLNKINCFKLWQILIRCVEWED